jgi:hypothetical protein
LKNYMNIDFKIGGITKPDTSDCCYNIISIFYMLHDVETAVRQGTVDCLSKKPKPNDDE